MPYYEYLCDSCKAKFEIKQKFQDTPLSDCPECGGKIHRVIQPTGFFFKGKLNDRKPNLVRGESGHMGQRVSETDEENLIRDQKTRGGRPVATPTRPKIL